METAGGDTIAGGLVPTGQAAPVMTPRAKPQT